MKKIFFGLLAMFAMTFVSCKDEAGNPDPGTPVNVAGAVEGTYTGTWTRTDAANADNVVSGTGTLTFTQYNDENYVVTVNAKCTDLGVDFTANANINPAFVFFNALPTDFGNSFSGRVTEEKDASISFAKTIKEGRKQYTYYYDFSGTKQ